MKTMYLIKGNFIGFNRYLKILGLNNIQLNSYFKYSTARQLEWPTDKIRKTFIDHFCERNQHKYVESSSVIPRKGAGTYFTNAGMVQFKDIILGQIDANDIIDPKRHVGIANSQKCIRIGGKHSDLDTIGKDDYHHTFFEMLGNWSFGNYDKETACRLALDLLVSSFKLDLNRLYFTYFHGDASLNLSPDLETKAIWKKLGINENRLIGFGMRENFWEMDVTGPCGPCTEIHYSRLNNPDDSKLVNAGDENVIELWNLVFMQYNRLSKSNFLPLPQLVVDTGMGLERLTAVMNNLKSNYEIDVFTPIFDKISEYTKANGLNVQSFYDCDSNNQLKSAYRTLSDHIRTITVSISDGLIPSRTGLGSYLKYIILKCIKIAQNDFKVRESPSNFLNSLVPVVVESLKVPYPQLKLDVIRIQEVLKNTDMYQQTKLDKAEEMCNRYMTKLKNPTALNGAQFWKLHKGDGKGEAIPIEYIESYAEKHNIKLDREGFDQIYLDETENSLKNVKHSRIENTQLIHICTQLKQKYKVPFTDDSFKYSFEIDDTINSARYLDPNGYLNANIVTLIRIDENKGYEIVDKINEDEKCIIVLNKTNFYAEKGGQSSDQGVIKVKNSDLMIEVDSVQQLQGYVFHFGTCVIKDKSENRKKAVLGLNESVVLTVNADKRYKATLNHTGVHLLNHSLRSFYKDENSIIQVNSSAKDHNLRLEFLLNRKSLEKPSKADIKVIQDICQSLVVKSLAIYESNVELEMLDKQSLRYPIRKLRDVLYPRNVRLVSIGERLEKLNDGSADYFISDDYSSELCCGTHAANTKQLKSFKIIDFSPTGDAYFEIEACTAEKAREIESNDRSIDKIYQEIIQCDLNSYDGLHEISKKCIQIELLSQNIQLSYIYRLNLIENLDKYRPSKSKLQKVLQPYLQSKIDSDSKKSMFHFESILSNDQIISVIKQLKTTCDVVVYYNMYRNAIFIYTNSQLPEIKQHELIKQTEARLFKPNESIKINIQKQVKNIKIIQFEQTVSKKDIISILGQ